MRSLHSRNAIVGWLRLQLIHLDRFGWNLIWKLCYSTWPQNCTVEWPARGDYKVTDETRYKDLMVRMETIKHGRFNTSKSMRVCVFWYRIHFPSLFKSIICQAFLIFTRLCGNEYFLLQGLWSCWDHVEWKALKMHVKALILQHKQQPSVLVW